MHTQALRQYCLNLAQRQPPLLSSSICRAAYNGDLDALRAFDGDVDAPDWSGLTPVHYALLGKGGLAALDILMSKGANPHFVTKSKETYLHFAALSGKPECVAKLCEHGLKVNKANVANQSPLHYAMVLTTTPGNMSMKSNPQYWSMYDALVQKGAKHSEKDIHGISPLHLIKMHLNAKNPADVRISDWILLGSSMAAWGTYFASQYGLTSEMPAGDVAEIITGSFLVRQLAELYTIFSNGDALPWLVGHFGLPMVGMHKAVPFYEAALGTKQIAESFKYTRQNMSYIGFQGWRNLAIHGANMVGAFAHAAVRSGMLPLYVYGAGSSGSYQRPQETFTPPPENWKDLSERERILHEGLDPTNPRHAEKILHCDKAKVEKYPTDAELEAREAVSGKLAQCKAYDSCIKETETQRNEECEQRYQPAEMEEDSPALERERQRLEECLGKPINPSRCSLEQGFWFDPDQCEAHQEAVSKVTSAYKSALKGCYRELSLKWHPDKMPEKDEAAFRRIGAAWETLSS